MKIKTKKVCGRCKGHYKTLSKKGLCAWCHKTEYGSWPKEPGAFTREGKTQGPHK